MRILASSNFVDTSKLKFKWALTEAQAASARSAPLISYLFMQVLEASFLSEPAVCGGIGA